MQSEKAYVQHHFVPRFLLAQWECGNDAKLSVFRYDNLRFLHSRLKAKSVAKIPHLYSTGQGASRNIALERDYLGPMIDTPAATVHLELVRSGAESLSESARRIWAKFLAAQLTRVPHQVAQIRHSARTQMLSKVEQATGAIDVETLQSPMLNDFGIKAYPWIVESDRLLGTFERARWATRNFSPAAGALLIGDNPLSLEGAMVGTFLYALPISPTCVFYAFNDEQLFSLLADADDETIIHVHNLDQIELARNAVFAIDDGLSQLIREHLRARVINDISAQHSGSPPCA